MPVGSGEPVAVEMMVFLLAAAEEVPSAGAGVYQSGQVGQSFQLEAAAACSLEVEGACWWAVAKGCPLAAVEVGYR
jgi:hypothetical protein